MQSDDMIKKPCPFCGSTKISLDWDYGYNSVKYYHVECCDCWARTGSVYTDFVAAVRAWNKRAE